MEEKSYTWEQVRAYSIIALHNLLHSANEVNKCNLYVSKNNNFLTRLELNRKILEGRVILAELNSLNIKITKIKKLI